MSELCFIFVTEIWYSCEPVVSLCGVNLWLWLSLFLMLISVVELVSNTYLCCLNLYLSVCVSELGFISVVDIASGLLFFFMCD